MDFNRSTIGFRSAATLSMSSEESDLKSSAESHGENSKLLISSDCIISIGKGKLQRMIADAGAATGCDVRQAVACRESLDQVATRKPDGGNPPWKPGQAVIV
jgi:hypothetical protein